MKTERKRYRYIKAVDAGPGAKLSSFRLIGGRHVKADHHGEVVLRIELTDDVALEKYSCDNYSTTEDVRLIGDFEYVILKWDGISERWKQLDVDVERIGDIEFSQLDYQRYLHHPKVVERKRLERLLTLKNFDTAFAKVEFSYGDRVVYGFYTDRIIDDFSGDEEKEAWLSSLHRYTYNGSDDYGFSGMLFTYDTKSNGGVVLLSESIDDLIEEEKFLFVTGNSYRLDKDDEDGEDYALDTYHLDYLKRVRRNGSWSYIGDDSEDGAGEGRTS